MTVERRATQRSDWKTEPLPEQCTRIRLERIFSASEMSRIRCGLLPEQMEDKWFIYCEGDTLYFHRSWTGRCIYVVSFCAQADGWRMLQALINRDPEQYAETDDEHDRALISYLIDVLLLDRPAQFPTQLTDAADQALANWSLVGRAMLGTAPHQRPEGDSPD